MPPLRAIEMAVGLPFKGAAMVLSAATVGVFPETSTWAAVRPGGSIQTKIAELSVGETSPPTSVQPGPTTPPSTKNRGAGGDTVPVAPSTQRTQPQVDAMKLKGQETGSGPNSL